MTSFGYRMMGLMGLIAIAAVGCGDDSGFTPPGLDELCDIDCGAGLAEGEATATGLASVDAFFGAVGNFQAKANGVSAGIEAELDLIRADFGIAADANLAAELDAQITANLEGGITIEAEPARCSVDARASLEAQARCDVEVDPGMAMIACKGSCEVEASAELDCGVDATLNCTLPSVSGSCEGSCSGSCEVMLEAAASCEGTCKGGCDGNCDAWVDDGNGGLQCSGSCDGMCSGSCETEVAGSAECSGSCKGECTVQVEGDAGCEGGIRASCEANADAMVMCEGSCEGEIEPPSAKAECQASAKAEASLNVECSPPRVAISYELKAGVDAAAQARFKAGLANLEVRLPSLLAKLKKAEAVLNAGEILVDTGVDAVTGATADLGDLGVVAKFKLATCLPGDLSAVGGVVADSASKVTASVNAAVSVTGSLGAS